MRPPYGCSLRQRESCTPQEGASSWPSIRPDETGHTWGEKQATLRRGQSVQTLAEESARMAAGVMDQAQMLREIRKIQADDSLSDAEKAKRRQALLSGSWKQAEAATQEDKAQGSKALEQEPAPKTTIFDESLKCAMCMDLCNRPITAPCQHNFCLGCFNKWTGQGKKTCPTCRAALPAKFSSNPRINTALATAIRMAKLGQERPASKQQVERMNDKDRPDEAFTTDRAVRAGRANASSGRIMVTVPGDHFGPIPPEADPRGTGVRVGEFWRDRLDCRQWGAHFPHVAGIAGQSGQGAQSVVLSGGYEDDRDEGEWFLYTGSGGRDLSGNKRVSNVQSFDQVFDKMNKALQVSCVKGLPVRVVRSHKEKKSAYAPSEEQPVRYDGIYRIAACYRKPGTQGKLVCRYLFRRCDNEPAPWVSDEAGDGPWEAELPAEALKDMKAAKGAVHTMSKDPWWDWNEGKQTWGWARDPPVSQRPAGGDGDEAAAGPKKLRRKASEHERALREFTCNLCSHVLRLPLSTPCGHHFCKPCLEGLFEERSASQPERTAVAARSLRVRKELKPCPTCKANIEDFMASAQVNQGMVEVISKLQEAAKQASTAAAKLEADACGDAAGDVEGACQEYAAAEAAVEEAAEAAGVAGSVALAAIAEEEPSQAQQEDEPGLDEDVPTQETAPVAAGSKAKQSEEEATESKMAGLIAEFGEFDEGLVRALLLDQAGDVLEVRVYLGKMRRAAAAAERKAKKTAAADVLNPPAVEAAVDGSPSEAPPADLLSGVSAAETKVQRAGAVGDKKAAAAQGPVESTEEFSLTVVFSVLEDAATILCSLLLGCHIIRPSQRQLVH
ncbi:hypothetical protein WJX73_001980 [Symbiochloris irregularis]|uniref:Uncharacterized protein n=1 Tax=Symbiochloris irregularis TaxID=706552 RepID=A0AAW1NVU6_9CHLO